MKILLKFREIILNVLKQLSLATLIVIILASLEEKIILKAKIQIAIGLEY